MHERTLKLCHGQHEARMFIFVVSLRQYVTQTRSNQYWFFLNTGFIGVLFVQIVLDSDDPLFGGFGRLDHNAEYFTTVRESSSLQLFFVIWSAVMI